MGLRLGLGLDKGFGTKMQRGPPLFVYFTRIRPVVKEADHFFNINILVSNTLDQRHLHKRNLIERTERTGKGKVKVRSRVGEKVRARVRARVRVRVRVRIKVRIRVR